MIKTTLFLSCALISIAATAQVPEPLLAIPDKIVLEADFGKARNLPKNIWQRRQGTRWAVAEGVLRGEQSSPEYQASKKDHFGYEPRLSIPVTPANFIASFRIRFVGGTETGIVPFIEFDHHVCRVRFNRDGAILLADHEVWKVADAPGFVWESGCWYSITAERKDSEFVMQIKDGPTLYADHPSFAGSAPSGGNGFGVAGPRKGQVEIDDIVIWSIKSDYTANWQATKAEMPKFTPVQVKAPKPKKSLTRKAPVKRSPAGKANEN
jgi:hypothetical protein